MKIGKIWIEMGRSRQLKNKNKINKWKECVRKNRLIQPIVITLERGGWIGWWSLFANLNYMNVRDNYMQVYNKQYKDNFI